MAEIVLFHHICGLTPGMQALAEDLRAAGHTVHTPDLYGGRTFDSIEAGAAFSNGPEAPDLDALADAAVADQSDRLVYLGISAGVMQAQRLAQTRPGAAGAILLESCLPITGEWAFGPWPAGVPVQIHGMDADAFFAGEGDVDAAREIVATVPDAELFLYRGDVHLFEDRSLPWFDESATALLTRRMLEFLDRTGRAAANG